MTGLPMTFIFNKRVDLRFVNFNRPPYCLNIIFSIRFRFAHRVNKSGGGEEINIKYFRQVFFIIIFFHYRLA